MHAYKSYHRHQPLDTKSASSGEVMCSRQATQIICAHIKCYVCIIKNQNGKRKWSDDVCIRDRFFLFIFFILFFFIYVCEWMNEWMYEIQFDIVAQEEQPIKTILFWTTTTVWYECKRKIGKKLYVYSKEWSWTEKKKTLSNDEKKKREPVK